MSYYRCPECGLTVQNVAGHFAGKVCPKCSVPPSSTDRIYVGERPQAALTCRFAAEREAASAARGVLKSLLWALHPDEYKVAALLTTELVANSVDHAEMAAPGVVRLDIALSDGLVRVEVRDEGPGFVPASRTPDSPLDSHWGLHLVDQLADRWAVAAEPNTLVWFELDRASPAHQTSAGSLELTSA